MLQSRDRKTIAAFEERIQRQPEIQRCDLITGAPKDYIPAMSISSMKDYNKYLREILSEFPRRSASRPVWSPAMKKNTPFLPIAD